MKNEMDMKAYKDEDHANTYHQLTPSSERSSEQIDKDYDRLINDGYVIIKNLISPDDCARIKSECLTLLNKTGRNQFEGLQTQRLYNVLSKTRATDMLAEHPRILGLMDKLFKPGYLLSQSQVINILSGEAPQGLHTDDAFYRIPRPRQPLGAATIWAIDEFTEENGATVVVPNSHHWDDDRIAKQEETISAIMPAGSVVFFLGTTWHGGGQNVSEKARFAITHQYCEAYMRQQENYLLELSKETVRNLSPTMQSLVGYSIFPPFMGMVEGMHPLRTLEYD